LATYGEIKMDEKKFQEMETALKNSMRRFPNCRIANCECYSKQGGWNKGCMCACHFFKMDKLYGKGKWKLSDMSTESKKGHPADVKEHMRKEIKQINDLIQLLNMEKNELLKKCPHEIIPIDEPKDHDSARCWICNKDFGWYCKNSPTKFCKYENDIDSCIYCCQPEERK
jgi:hypothetical protein